MVSHQVRGISLGFMTLASHVRGLNKLDLRSIKKSRSIGSFGFASGDPRLGCVCVRVCVRSHRRESLETLCPRRMSTSAPVENVLQSTDVRRSCGDNSKRKSKRTKAYQVVLYLGPFTLSIAERRGRSSTLRPSAFG